MPFIGWAQRRVHIRRKRQELRLDITNHLTSFMPYIRPEIHAVVVNAYMAERVLDKAKVDRMLELQCQWSDTTWIACRDKKARWAALTTFMKKAAVMS